MIQPKPPSSSTVTLSSKMTHSSLHQESRPQIQTHKMKVLDLEMTHRKSAVVLVANVLKTSHNSCDPTLSPTVKVKKEPNPIMQG